MTYALVGSLGTPVQSASGGAISGLAFGQATTANNLLVAFWAGDGSATIPTAASLGTGWTLPVSQAGTSCAAAIYFKIAGGSDAVPTFGAITSAVQSVMLAEFSGNRAASPKDRVNGAAGTTSPLAATNAAADNAAAQLVLCVGTGFYSDAVTKTLTNSLNNGATVADTNNNASSSANHYAFGWGVTTAKTVADSDSFAFTTTNVTGAAAVIASFFLPAVISSESLTVTDTPALKGGAQPVVSESLTVTDSPVLKGGAQPKPSEALTVADTPVVQGPAQPQASEAITVTDTPAVLVAIAPVTTAASEAVALTDTPAVFLPVLTEAAAETVTVTDTPTVQGPSQPVASQAVTVSETTAVLLPFLLVAASQAVTLTETVVAQVPVTASVSETVTVTDSPALKGGAQPQPSESLTVTDSPAVKGGAQPKPSETVSVTDTPVVQLPGSAALSIHASETLSVTETLTPILPYLTVAAADTLHATDTPAVQAIIRVAASEQITVSTTVRLPINYIDAQSGTLTFTGSATSSIGPDLNVTWKRQHLYYVDYRNWVRGP